MSPGRKLSAKSARPEGQSRPQARPQLLARVLQAEHEQQQDDADLRADVHEPLTDVERQQPAVAKGEPRQQIERDRRESPPAGEPRQHRQTDDRRAQLDEDPRDVGRGGGEGDQHGRNYTPAAPTVYDCETLSRRATMARKSFQRLPGLKREGIVRDFGVVHPVETEIAENRFAARTRPRASTPRPSKRDPAAKRSGPTNLVFLAIGEARLAVLGDAAAQSSPRDAPDSSSDWERRALPPARRRRPAARLRSCARRSPPPAKAPDRAQVPTIRAPRRRARNSSRSNISGGRSKPRRTW